MCFRTGAEVVVLCSGLKYLVTFKELSQIYYALSLTLSLLQVSSVLSVMMSTCGSGPPYRFFKVGQQYSFDCPGTGFTHPNPDLFIDDFRSIPEYSIPERDVRSS